MGRGDWNFTGSWYFQYRFHCALNLIFLDLESNYRVLRKVHSAIRKAKGGYVEETRIEDMFSVIFTPSY